MDKRIVEFLCDEHLLSFSVLERQKESFEIHTASCYYAFDKENLSFIIKSNPASKHIILAIKYPNIAINITKDSSDLNGIRGVQVKAMLGDACKTQKAIYYRRFPFARLHYGELFACRILWLKYTHNALGKKIIFENKAN